VDTPIRLRRRQRADAVVEFAILAPTLVLILFGILELGRVVDAWIVVHNAAREGARAGGMVNPVPDPGTAAQQAATTYLQQASATRSDVVSILVPAPVVAIDSVQVTAQMNVRIDTPIIQSIVASPLPVRASVTMPR